MKDFHLKVEPVKPIIFNKDLPDQNQNTKFENVLKEAIKKQNTKS